MDRMQSEVRALQQQAQATQQSLKQLQARESTTPYGAIVSDLPRVFSGVDSTMLGMGCALALATVAVWWYVWHRPHTRSINASAASARKEAQVSTRVPLSDYGGSLHGPSSTQLPVLAPHDDVLAWEDPGTEQSHTTPPKESGHSPFAQRESNIEFDPEAAAGEVTRVRKSLAEKREARAQLQDRDDSAHAELDLDLDLSLWPEPQPLTPSREPITPVDEQVSFSLVEEEGDRNLQLAQEPLREPALKPVSEPEFALEPAPAPAPIPMPDMEPAPGLVPEPQDSGSKGYDFTITLALAQESAGLELWNEARDLASEVLESDDPNLVSEALSLLERLNQMELEAPVDTPPPTGVR